MSALELAAVAVAGLAFLIGCAVLGAIIGILFAKLIIAITRAQP